MYKNSVRKLRQHDLFPREKKANKVQRLDTNAFPIDGKYNYENFYNNNIYVILIILIIPEVQFAADITDSQLWLKHHRDPWPTVETKWAETYYLRKKTIDAGNNCVSNIAKEWPLFIHADGARLVIYSRFILY